MDSLRAWHQVAVPQEDLRRGEPLDAAKFAIHLDQVIDGRAPRDYVDPQRFFARTYLTDSFRAMAAEVLRRLNGHLVGTSPGFNLTTQFGGGKTHFLTLLYHLVRSPEQAPAWQGVGELLERAGLSQVPRARVGVFIGNRFDFVVGSGAEGEPRRQTPWGDLAWQLGGAELFARVQEHDERGIVPGGETLQQLFSGEPTLILMDEVLSFIRRAREAGEPYARLASQFYSFLDVLTREIAGTSQVVLVVSLPLSEYEMTQADEVEFQRLDKLLGRLSKAVLLSERTEIAEIVRRRLFEEVGERTVVKKVAQAYASWVLEHRNQLPEWFPVESAERIFEASYPFHPTVLSVFERKWQSLPRFQRTRGVLRLLAHWVSLAYQRAFVEAGTAPLITLGSAPLDDALFRAAVFEQLGEERLEAAVLSDIAGEEAHAVRLDAEAPESIRYLRLHQQVATAVFFESSGGQVRNEATLAEVRLAVGEPNLDIGSIEGALEDLVRRCYYLDARGTVYWLSHRATLNKILADRRAALAGPQVEETIRERVRSTVRDAFRGGTAALDRRYFPETPDDIPDTPALTLVVLSPEDGWEPERREATQRRVERMLREYTGRGRTFKSGLIFVAPEGGAGLSDEVRTLLALETLEEPAEQERLRLEPSQIRELREKKQRSDRDLKEKVWRSYRYVLLLAEDGGLQQVDLGLLHSSAAESLTGLIVARLRQEGLLEEHISPDFLVRNWPPAVAEEWSTKAVREMFYASPRFPRLLNPESLRDTLAEGVRAGKFGYVGKRYGEYQAPLRIEDSTFHAAEVEFSDQVFLLPRERALALREALLASTPDRPEVSATAREKTAEPFTPGSETTGVFPAPSQSETEAAFVQPSVSFVKRLAWEGDLPPQKWTNFYMKVLTRFATDPSLRLRLRFEVSPDLGVAPNQIAEIKHALRELGLNEQLEEES